MFSYKPMYSIKPSSSINKISPKKVKIRGQYPEFHLFLKKRPLPKLNSKKEKYFYFRGISYFYAGNIHSNSKSASKTDEFVLMHLKSMKLQLRLDD